MSTDVRVQVPSLAPFPFRIPQYNRRCARVVELADSLDSGSSVLYGRAGSSPASRTSSEIPLTAPLPAPKGRKAAPDGEFLRFPPRLASLDSRWRGERGCGAVFWGKPVWTVGGSCPWFAEYWTIQEQLSSCSCAFSGRVCRVGRFFPSGRHDDHCFFERRLV